VNFTHANIIVTEVPRIEFHQNLKRFESLEKKKSVV